MLVVRSAGVKVTTIMPTSIATHFDNHSMTEKKAWKIQSEEIGQLVIDSLKMHHLTLPSNVEVRPSTHLS